MSEAHAAMFTFARDARRGYEARGERRKAWAMRYEVRSTRDEGEEEEEEEGEGDGG